ncbi:MAG: hypothetical protein U1E03_08460 [Hyphomonadaceae bacterium]
MIKRASGDWTRLIPPWATVRKCDLRRYRGPYRDINDELDQKQRAILLLGAALKRARTSAAEFVAFRVGDGKPGRDAFRVLLREFICSKHADVADLGRSRQYPDRIVVALKARPHRSSKGV